MAQKGGELHHSLESGLADVRLSEMINVAELQLVDCSSLVDPRVPSSLRRSSPMCHQCNRDWSHVRIWSQNQSARSHYSPDIDIT